MDSTTINTLLLENSLRNTKIRQAMLALISHAKNPVSVPELIEMLDTLGISANKTTLYRQVELFVNAGILKELNLESNKIHYELANLDHHHHLICSNCQKVEHIEVPRIEDHVAHLIKETFKTSGFQIKKHSLEFFGLCRKCL